jgi:hypothetical protein
LAARISSQTRQETLEAVHRGEKSDSLRA